MESSYDNLDIDSWNGFKSGVGDKNFKELWGKFIRLNLCVHEQSLKRRRGENYQKTLFDFLMENIKLRRSIMIGIFVFSLDYIYIFFCQGERGCQSYVNEIK